MRVIPLVALSLGVLLLTLPLHAEQGQGEADPNATIDGLNIGTYWYGAPVDKRDLIGKVVLVEIWGS